MISINFAFIKRLGLKSLCTRIVSRYRHRIFRWSLSKFSISYRAKVKLKSKLAIYMLKWTSKRKEMKNKNTPRGWGDNQCGNVLFWRAAVAPKNRIEEIRRLQRKNASKGAVNRSFYDIRSVRYVTLCTFSPTNLIAKFKYVICLVLQSY